MFSVGPGSAKGFPFGDTYLILLWWGLIRGENGLGLVKLQIEQITKLEP